MRKVRGLMGPERLSAPSERSDWIGVKRQIIYQRH